jgi:hypothetical protein
MFTSIRTRTTRRALAVAAMILLPAIYAVQQPASAGAATVLLPANFLNNSSYPIVALTVDNRQVVPGLAAAIPPHATLSVGLTIGSHTYSAANGLNSDFTMYTFRGSFTVRLSLPTPANLGTITFGGHQSQLTAHAAVFNDPTLAQLLTRFGTNHTWNADFFDDNGAFHLATFTFSANGTYVFSVDNRQLGSNSYTLVSRNPPAQTVTFSVGGTLHGVFSETQGVFFMPNGPTGGTLEYR